MFIEDIITVLFRSPRAARERETGVPKATVRIKVGYIKVASKLVWRRDTGVLCLFSTSVVWVPLFICCVPPFPQPPACRVRTAATSGFDYRINPGNFKRNASVSSRHRTGLLLIYLNRCSTSFTLRTSSDASTLQAQFSAHKSLYAPLPAQLWR